MLDSDKIRKISYEFVAEYSDLPLFQTICKIPTRYKKGMIVQWFAKSVAFFSKPVDFHEFLLYEKMYTFSTSYSI